MKKEKKERLFFYLVVVFIFILVIYFSLRTSMDIFNFIVIIGLLALLFFNQYKLNREIGELKVEHIFNKNDIKLIKKKIR